ncbi:hypothetical protein [Kribbella sp.]|nr:hypothetical protein [Kribbella sp.]HZX06375.1 hypothetical protein [Kribbella sp.]
MSIVVALINGMIRLIVVAPNLAFKLVKELVRQIERASRRKRK